MKLNFLAHRRNSLPLLFGLGYLFFMSKKVRFLDSKALDTLSENYRLRFSNSAINNPHLDKKSKGGEDANYISSNLIAVADGVGGWNEYGIDPSLYSKELCRHIEEENEKNNDFSEKGAKEILIKSAYRTKAIGSSTCCLILLDTNSNKIYTANIGDSGYLILRYEEGKLVEIFKSEEQQHSFNFPFQIGTNGDNPDKALTNTHLLEINDIIVLGTDGLWDNLYSMQIIEILNNHISKNGRINNTQEAAQAIANFAELKSLERNYESPFAKKAKQYKVRYKGGKPDDITVIVSQLEKVNKDL